jgi:hypothetical protein
MMDASYTLDSSYVCEESFEKTKKMDWRKLKDMDRKRARLQNIVEDLSSPVKAKVVRQFVHKNPRALDEILAYTTSQNNFEAKVNDLVIQKLYQLRKQKKFSTFYSLFDQFFGEQTEDEPFMAWLIKKLGCRFNQFMQRYQQWHRFYCL